MKDPHGHGSSTHGGGSMLDQLRGRLGNSRVLKGSKPISDEEVAANLRTKHGPDPIHPAMSGGMDAVRALRGTTTKLDWSDAPISPTFTRKW